MSKSKTAQKPKNGQYSNDPVSMLFEDDETLELEVESAGELVEEVEVPVKTVSMAAHRRLNSYVVRGEVTGQSYTILSTGTAGIDLRDAVIIAESQVQVRCLRTGLPILICPAGILR